MNPNNIRPNPLSPHPYQNYYPPIQSPTPSLTVQFQSPSKYNKPNVYGSNLQFFQPNKQYVQNGSTPSPLNPSSENNSTPMNTLKQTEPPVSNNPKNEKFSEDIHILFPKSKLYTKLLELEKKIDLILKRRQFSLQDQIKQLKESRLLKLCVHHTFEEIRQNDNETISPVTSTHFSLRIEGKIIDDLSAKFSQFFKKITIKLDENEFPENHTIEWVKNNNVEPVPGFEIKRKYTKDTNVKILLYLDEPDLFTVSDGLSNLLQIKSDSKVTNSEVILKFWNYIQINKLNDPERRSCIVCNENLAKVFGVQKIEYCDIPKLIQPHLTPVDPILIEHTISKDNIEQWFEIPVESEIYQSSLPNLDTSDQAINDLNSKIMENIKKVNEKKRKRDLLLKFANQPLTFVDDFIDSQQKDHKMIEHFQNKEFDPERQTEVFLQPLIIDSVKNFMSRKANRYLQNVPISQTKSEQ